MARADTLTHTHTALILGRAHWHASSSGSSPSFSSFFFFFFLCLCAVAGTAELSRRQTGLCPPFQCAFWQSTLQGEERGQEADKQRERERTDPQ